MDLNRLEGHDSWGIYRAVQELQLLAHPTDHGLYVWRLHSETEGRWDANVWAGIDSLVTPGLGVWDLGTGIPRPDAADIPRAMQMESCHYPQATLVEFPPSILVDRLDVGHAVICVSNSSACGRTGTVERRYTQTGTQFIDVEGFNGSQLEANFAALVPGGDYARVEEALPGELRWPVGTRVSWVTGDVVRLPEGGLVTKWREDGMCVVMDDTKSDEPAFLTVDRRVLDSGVLHPHLTRRRRSIRGRAPRA